MKSQRARPQPYVRRTHAAEVLERRVLLDAASPPAASLDGPSVLAAASVAPAATTALRIDDRYGTIETGQTYGLTIVARDGASIDRGYRGTIHFQSTDPAAALPADYTFTAEDDGFHRFNITFNTAGPQTLTVSDAAGLRDQHTMLLSGVSLRDDGTLAVVGRDESDVVDLSAAGGTVTARLNGTVRQYDAGRVVRADVRTLGGDDTVTLRAGAPGGDFELGDAAFNGNRVTVEPGALGPLTLRGGRGSDKVEISSGVTAPLHFDGGSGGIDEIRVWATDGADRIAISGTGVAFQGPAPAPGQPEPPDRWAATLARAGRLEVVAGGGDDVINVGPILFEDAMSVRVEGGGGNDSLSAVAVQTSGSGVGFYGGEGDDNAALEIKPGNNWRGYGFGFYGGPGENTLTVGGTPAIGGVHVTESSADADSTKVGFRDVQTLLLNTGGGGNNGISVNIRSSFENALRTVRIDAGDGPDYITVGRVAPEVSVSILGGAGDDTFHPGYGAARFDGGAGEDSLGVLTSNWSDAVTVTPSSLRWASTSEYADADARAGAAWEYAGMELVEVNTDYGADVVTLAAAPGGGGSLDALPAVRIAASPPVNVGLDSLDVVVDDRGNAAGGEYVLTPTALLRPGGAPVEYQLVRAVTLRGGGGADRVTVWPASATEFIVHGGDAPAGSQPGDRLDLSPGQASGGALTPDAGAAGSGRYTFADRRPVVFTGIETVDTDLAPSPPATVVARHLFYNASAFDGRNAVPDAADDAAIAPDKRPLLPGESPTAANVITAAHGITGVMIDVAGLPPGAAQSLSKADFALRNRRAGTEAWADGPADHFILLRRGAGVNGSDRVTLAFYGYDPGSAATAMAVANGWLEVAMRATEGTGLARADVFHVGSLIGDTADGGGAAPRVNALDLAAVKRALNTPAGVESRLDFDRDGRINALDLAAVRANLGRSLPSGAPPAAAPGPAPAPLDVHRLWRDEAPAVLG